MERDTGDAGGELRFQSDHMIAEKDPAIVLAAREHPLRDAFAGASMDGIAKSASVSVKTIYSHFADKEELFSKIMIAACTDQLLSEELPSDEVLAQRVAWDLPDFPVVFQMKMCDTPFGIQQDGVMGEKSEVQQGTLALMVLKTLDVLGPQHGYGIARRIEQISGDLLSVNQGTLYPLLLKLEQEDAIESEWGTSDRNRRARFYRLTQTGRKHLRAEMQDWRQTALIMERFLGVKLEDLA
jgi:PadR family transcriptional regulator PadR